MVNYGLRGILHCEDSILGFYEKEYLLLPACFGIDIDKRCSAIIRLTPELITKLLAQVIGRYKCLLRGLDSELRGNTLGGRAQRDDVTPILPFMVIYKPALCIIAENLSVIQCDRDLYKVGIAEHIKILIGEIHSQNIGIGFIIGALQ